MPNKILTVRDVSKRFDGIVANERLSIDVELGQIVGLIGPNGSGKTTLFNSIAGSHRIDTGEIFFNNQAISHLRSAAIARQGLLRTFQQPRLYHQLSVLNNMRLSTPVVRFSLKDILTHIKPEIDDNAMRLLTLTGLQEKQHLAAGELSYGQQKLLEFAMALMNEPKLLLLDEPTAGINPSLINHLIEHLRDARDKLGMTLLVIEHNMHVIMDLADHIYCLAHGQLLAQGTPTSIQKNPQVIDAYLGST